MKIFAVAVVAGLAAGAVAQDFTIEMVAPASVNQGDTYTVQVFGSVSGVDFSNAAIAGFGFDVLNGGGAAGVAGLSTATIPVLTVGTNVGTVNGADLTGLVGGQLANLFGFLNPNIDTSNPLLLFTFDVTTGADFAGDITYSGGNPNLNGGLSFYPNNQEGTSVIAPNDAGTTLSFVGATTNVVPAPAGLALLGLGALAAGRRRA